MDSNMDKHSYMLKWEPALVEELSTEQWQIIWSQAAKISICTLYEENTYKVLFFWYMNLLHAIYSSDLDRYWRCRRNSGTLLHIYWQCPSLQPHWCSVQDLLHRLFDVDIPLHLKMYLLRATPPQVA